MQTESRYSITGQRMAAGIIIPTFNTLTALLTIGGILLDRWNMNQRGDGKMGRVTVEVEVANNEDVLKAEAGTLAVDQIRRVRLQGIVDTWAARLVLPQHVVGQLGLPRVGEASVRYADRRTAVRPIVKNVWLQLQGRNGDFSAIIEPDRTDALIGAIVLEELDLMVDCVTQTLHPRDPDRIISEIE